MTIDEIKICSKSILDYLDSVCKNNNLHYFLCGGTLLGAVRHKGFIPWDDDIDIMMPRSDYEKLFVVWPQDSIYKFLCHKNTRNFPYAYGKVIDTRTIKEEPIRNSCRHLGVDVDVFPIDSIPDNHDESVLFFDNIARWQALLNRHITTFGSLTNCNCIKTVAYNCFILFLRIGELLGLRTVDSIVSGFSRYAQKYNSQHVSFCGITVISHYGIREKNPKIGYERVINVQFEGSFYPAPIGYNQYLCQLYGDNYMELPPVEMRQSHHSYKAFWQ